MTTYDQGAALSGYLSQLEPTQVNDAISFANFAQQRIGTPIPTAREYPILRKKLNEFFASQPQADWITLVHTVDWCKAKKRRPALPWSVISQVRWAWADGVCPELDPRTSDVNVELAIIAALEVETDPHWRRRLIGARGVDGRLAAYRAWMKRGDDEA